jgi:hypothetical protein
MCQCRPKCRSPPCVRRVHHFRTVDLARLVERHAMLSSVDRVFRQVKGEAQLLWIQKSRRQEPEKEDPSLGGRAPQLDDAHAPESPASSPRCISREHGVFRRSYSETAATPDYIDAPSPRQIRPEAARNGRSVRPSNAEPERPMPRATGFLPSHGGRSRNWSREGTAYFDVQVNRDRGGANAVPRRNRVL